MFLWHDQCNWTQYKTSISNDEVDSLDHVGMLFLSDLSRQECSTHTTTSPQEFDGPDSPTGHGQEKRFSQTTNTRWRQVTRCVGRVIALLPEYAGKRQPLVRTSECAEKSERHSRTSPSARRTGSRQVSYSTEFADGPNRRQRILHSSKNAQESRIRTAQSARTQPCSRQFTKRGRCNVPGYGAQHQRR